jgi:hypothetical protein
LQVRPSFDLHAWFEDRKNRAAAGIPSNSNPLISFIPAGKANNAPSYFDPDKNNFAPRIGLAWTPSFSSGVLHKLLGDPGQSSIRFGASMVYDRIAGALPVMMDLNGAYGLTVSGTLAPPNYSTAPRFNGLQNLDAIPLAAPPPTGFPATPDFTFNTGLTTGFLVDTKLRTPYSTTFSLAISRELPGNFTVETAYVGRIGRKLLVQSDLAAPVVNFKDRVSGQSWIQASGIIADLISKETPVSEVPAIPFLENVFAPLADGVLTASQAFYTHMQSFAPSWTDGLRALDLQPNSTIYGQYTFFQQQFDWLPTWTNEGQSSYHSLQLSMRKRFSNGFQADVNYTLAKSLDNGSSTESEGKGIGQMLNAFDHRQALSYSDFDVRHQVNANFVLNLPFGRGRTFANNLGSSLNGIVGGWRLTGIAHWRTGFPFGNTSGNGFSFPTNFAVNGPPTLKTNKLPKIRVNKDADGGPNIFADPQTALDSFEHTKSGFSGSRNVLHGPGFFTLDTGLQKSFSLGEQKEIQFRWEVFNMTNTVNFDGRVYPIGNKGIDFDLDAPSSFGRLRSLAGSPRVMQFALRYQF